MAKSKNDIISELENFMGKYGGSFGDWYVGASDDPKNTMYNTHGFKKGDVGLIRSALTEMQAHDVVEFFVDVRGCVGRVGSIKIGELHVYAYRRGNHTNP